MTERLGESGLEPRCPVGVDHAAIRSLVDRLLELGEGCLCLVGIPRLHELLDLASPKADRAATRIVAAAPGRALALLTLGRVFDWNG